MTKRIFAVVILLVMAFVMVAPATFAQDEVNLRWRTRPDNQAEIDLYQSVSDGIDEPWEGVTLTYEPGGSESSSYQDVLLAELEAGTAPDVFWIPGTDVARFAKLGVIANLAEDSAQHPLVPSPATVRERYGAKRVLRKTCGRAVDLRIELEEVPPSDTVQLTRFDVGGVPVRPHLNQIPGSCRDYFTVQGWVDFNNGERGVTIATPENPMVQLGDFHFAHDQQEVTLERAMLLGWVTNNYWETNFPGAQPGVVTARYAILPYEGDFDEARSHRLAAEAEHARPVVQHLGEPAALELLPARGTLLHLRQPPVLTLSLRACKEGGALLTLFNASDRTQSAAVASGLVKLHTAHRCDLFGSPLEELRVEHGRVEILIPPRQTCLLQIETG